MAETNEAIGTIAGEIMSIAVEHGYEGPQDLTIAGAIDALADTLAGENVESGQTVAQAVRALAPYIGSGGGAERVKLFEETVTTAAQDSFNLATLSYKGEITDDSLYVVFDGVEYELPFTNGGYGAAGETGPDFSTYPLFLYDNGGGSWILYTETASTHIIVAYKEKSSGSELGAGYPLRTDVAATVYASDKPLSSGLDKFGAKLALSSTADATDQLMPAGLYVAVFIVGAAVEPTATGVDATIEDLSGGTSAYAVHFKMPSNAVTISAIK